ncbi:ubiquinone/menaquinone biosynthesis C-methylase UbiE [Natronobacillus azotifigens]|uniref:Class I SAM-dependent methyltransferase n=1 Tax=Natronobacillus azotifigens TaxID=472978 RepID=A0A9J6R9U6_9BACI|nr:class I SAM-dependent methyltransferase [Natronobacillus azotifigens]MCZ0702319.1 class I SAM-dependent methyltransferase [Natronobacillus azotifigens]
MTYNKMAAVYDTFMEQAPYEEWCNFTIHMINKYRPNQVNKIVDLGCGTGQIACQLAEADFQLTGIDLAPDMLSQAAARSSEESLSIQWIEQDLRSLSSLADFDLAVSYCDVINYLTSKAEVKKTFDNVYDLLTSDGLFIFDVHSMSYVENALKDQVFSEVFDDLAYIWFCEGSENKGEMFHDLTFFVEEDGKYDRFDERHHQYTFPYTVYKEILESAGFILEGIYGDFSLEVLDQDQIEEAQRLFFVCTKQAK